MSRTTSAVEARRRDHPRAMYDIQTRRRLAQEIVDAFCEGGRWDPDSLAERAAGRLEDRPAWLEDLVAHVPRRPVGSGSVATQGVDRAERRRLVHAVERHLGERVAGPSDASAPRIIRDRTRSAAPLRWPCRPLGSVIELADALELDLGQLEWLADVRGLERTASRERLRNYRYRWVPRRTGVPRLIEAPKLRLKEIQRFVLREILDRVPAHDAAHGFVRGRSVVGNAVVHAGRPAVLRFDLRDFFASVAAGRVFGVFTAIGYDASVAHALTGLATNTTAAIARDAIPPLSDPALVGPRFRLRRMLATPHLPQGAPTSPALANLATYGLDRRLAALAAACDLRYTRYADDLTFSGDLGSGSRARSIAATVGRIVRDEGFHVHPRKSTLRTAAHRQVVTGVVVNSHPNLGRNEYDRLRATLHRAALDGPEAVVLPGHTRPTDSIDLRAHLSGRVAWVESLDAARGAKLRRQLNRIDWDRGGVSR